MYVWHNRIIFNFLYFEYRHNKLVLSLGAKAEIHSFEGCVGMRLSDYILRVPIYCNLPDSFHRTVDSERFPVLLRIELVRTLPGL